MQVLARSSRSGILALVTALSACAEPWQSAAWSLPPRDNPLARALEQSRDENLLFLRMNAAVDALTAAEALRPSQPRQCERVPLPGCVYVVQVATVRGKQTVCERNEYRIVESTPGPPVVSRRRSEQVACPPAVAK